MFHAYRGLIRCADSSSFWFLKKSDLHHEKAFHVEEANWIFIGNTGSAVGATESKCVPSHWLIVAQKILKMY